MQYVRGSREESQVERGQPSGRITIMPCTLPPIPDLVLALRELIDQVPRGRATTAGRLASALGNPVAARWIGHYLLHHDHDANCACHRVLRAGGTLGPYPEGSDEKVRRLQADGVEVVSGNVDLDRFGCGAFTIERAVMASE